MTHLWVDGVPVVVETTGEGLPRSFTWRGVLHPVQAVANTWQVDEEWWSRRQCRDYYKLTTATGLLVILYHDLVGGQWWLERLYD